MFGFKQRRALRDAKRAYDLAILDGLRADNDRRLAELRGPGYCRQCMLSLVARGMSEHDAIHTLTADASTGCPICTTQRDWSGSAVKVALRKPPKVAPR